MNLVEQIVATNAQYVLSKDLAGAAGMTHEELCQFLEEYRAEIEVREPLQKIANNGFLLDINQTFAAVIFMELSNDFYEREVVTPADELKLDLKASFIKVFHTLLKANAKRSNVKVDMITGMDID